MVKAFQDSKAMLTGALIHHRPDAPTTLTINTSEEAVGAALQQLVQVAWQPLAFFSKQLHLPEIVQCIPPQVVSPVPRGAILQIFSERLGVHCLHGP